MPSAIRLPESSHARSINENYKKRWSGADVEYLEASYGVVSDAWIARRLGRPVSAIRWKAQHLRLLRTDNFLTASAVARIFGVYVIVPIRWIRQGKLVAKKNMNVRGGVWQIEENALVSFIRDFPSEFDLRRMDRINYPYFYNQARQLAASHKPARSIWSAEMNAFLLNNNSRLSLNDLARKLNKSKQAVACQLTRLRAKKHILPQRPQYFPQRRWTTHDIDFLRHNWGNRPASEIALALDRALPGVIGKARRLGLPANKKAIAGQLHSRQEAA